MGQTNSINPLPLLSVNLTQAHAAIVCGRFMIKRPLRYHPMVVQAVILTLKAELDTLLIKSTPLHTHSSTLSDIKMLLADSRSESSSIQFPPLVQPDDSRFYFHFHESVQKLSKDGERTNNLGLFTSILSRFDSLSRCYSL